MKNIPFTLIVSIFFLFNHCLLSQATFSNYSYNTFGYQKNFIEGDYYGQDMHVDDDGSMIIVGTSKIEMDSKIIAILLKPNGSIDRGFGENGVVEIGVDYSKNSLANTVIKIDNHYVIGGESGTSAFLIKLTAEGKRVSSFGDNGIVRVAKMKKIEAISTFYSKDTYSIIAAGSCKVNQQTRPGLMRFNENGEWLESYGKKGKALVDHQGAGSFTDIKVSSNGHVIACGTLEKPIRDYEDAIVAKFRPDGKKYQSFGAGKGYTIIDAPIKGYPNSAVALEINEQGQITICGNFQHESDEDIYACRLKLDGTLDRAFGLHRNGYYCSNYKNEADGVQSLCIQNNGKLILGGKSNFHGNFDSNLTRLNVNGLPDLSFGNNSWKLKDFSSGNDSIGAMHISINNSLFILSNSSTSSKNTVVITKQNLENPLRPNFLDLVLF